MIDTFTSTQELMTALTGQWLNPVTGTRFYFTPAINQPDAGVIVIRAAGNASSLTINFTSQTREGSIMLVLAGNQYPMYIIGTRVKSLAICLSPGNYLQLVKRNE